MKLMFLRVGSTNVSCVSVLVLVDGLATGFFTAFGVGDLGLDECLVAIATNYILSGAFSSDFREAQSSAASAAPRDIRRSWT